MPVADSAEDVLLRDAHVVVDDLAVVRGRPAPDADAAHDLHALRGGRHDELRHGAFAPLGRLVAVGHAGHHDEEVGVDAVRGEPLVRSEEHTSELQSLMRISYAVFSLENTN